MQYPNYLILRIFFIHHFTLCSTNMGAVFPTRVLNMTIARKPHKQWTDPSLLGVGYKSSLHSCWGGNLAHTKVPAKILIFEFHCVDQKTAKWSTIQKITLLSQILKVWKKKVPWYGLNLAITQTFDNSPINRFSVHCSEFGAFSETASILYRFL